MRVSLAARLSFFVALVCLHASAQCPLMCSKKGRCVVGDVTTNLLSRCDCFEGWSGPSCSVRVCPSAPAWISYGAGGVDDVHGVDAECAGVGTCVRKTGVCTCPAPFSGIACQRLGCLGSTAICSDHGACTSLAGAAALGLSTGAPALPYEASTYGAWDASRVQGCVCDAGWTGADCATVACPVGDDPNTPGVSRIVAVRCECRSGSLCSRALFIRIGAAFAVVPSSAVATIAEERVSGESVESILRAMAPDMISSVEIAGTGVCATDAELRITFLNAAGNSVRLSAEPAADDAAPGAAEPIVTIADLRTATTESLVCSGRGTCSSAGKCNCFTGYFSSDGNGAPGVRGDCGTRFASVTANASIIAGCTQNCNQAGWCDVAAGYVCRCNGRASGGSCQNLECPVGRAWFDQPSPDGTAHRNAICSNAGRCAASSGLCTCLTGFTGESRGGVRELHEARSAKLHSTGSLRSPLRSPPSPPGSACERLICPGASTVVKGTTCSGRGVCLSLKELVKLGTAGGVPIGGGLRPVQTLSCGTANGALQFSYKWATSAAVKWDATPEELATTLSNIFTLGAVRVLAQPALTGGAYATPMRICSGDAERPFVHELSFPHDTGAVDALGVENLGSDDGGRAIITVVTAGSTPSYGTVQSSATWDADMMQGCHCDGYPEWNSTSPAGDGGAWRGPACASRACPTGINPYGPPSVLEVQRISCLAGSGSFTLTFRGQTTPALDFDVSIDELRDALQDLPSIGLVDVTFEDAAVEALAKMKSGDAFEVAAAARACGYNPGEPRATLIRFTTELGNVPMVTAQTSRLFGPTGTAEAASMVISESTAGSGELVECSGLGSCDEATGLCTCLETWLSSDGLGAQGRRGDCSARQRT